VRLCIAPATSKLLANRKTDVGMATNCLNFLPVTNHQTLLELLRVLLAELCTFPYECRSTVPHASVAHIKFEIQVSTPTAYGLCVDVFR
jgi:hypothetical protein